MFKCIAILNLIALFSINFSYALIVGLDSGHSIKELYKSGGSFEVKVKEKQPDGSFIEVPKPYYSIAWPAGGVDILTQFDRYGNPVHERMYVKMTNSIDLPTGWDKIDDNGTQWEDVRFIKGFKEEVDEFSLLYTSQPLDQVTDFKHGLIAFIDQNFPDLDYRIES